MYAHFQLGSIRVKVGDKISRGQVLGLVGNSGNSSEPHLHFSTDGPQFSAGQRGLALQDGISTHRTLQWLGASHD